jgi:hypothetical protein
MAQRLDPAPPRPNHEAIPPEQLPAASPLPNPPERHLERRYGWAWWALLLALAAATLLAWSLR